MFCDAVDVLCNEVNTLVNPDYFFTLGCQLGELALLITAVGLLVSNYPVCPVTV